MDFLMARFGGFFAIACCVVIVAAPAVAQISPGKLSKPHKEIDGVKNCLKCHALGSGPSASKCLDCHKSIAGRIEEQKGLHHLSVTEEGKNCIECHSEHAGRDFELVYWEGGREQFDHKKAGWELHGVHAEQKCRKCHKAENVQERLTKMYDDMNVKTTFLGLDTRCLGCHVDEHRGQLKEDCTTCHDHKGFKPAPKFDHDKSKFKLVGKHNDVKCEKCHPKIKKVRKGKKPYVKYVDIDFKNCSSCHKEPHNGRLGADCKSCHNPQGFSKVETAKFDHSKTRFPLIGKHRKVKCDVCHKEKKKTEDRQFETCMNCHTDNHRGQFKDSFTKGSCEQCHDNNGFAPAHYTVADHARSRFPLVGAHLAVPCTQCHLILRDSKGEYREYRMDDRSCARCHGAKDVKM
jgi:hypothetical protein